MSKAKLRLLAPRSLFADGLTTLLRDQFEITDHEPDLVLVDTTLVRDGVVEPLLAETPEAKVVIIGDGFDLMHMSAMFALGARAYVRHMVGLNTLLDILELVLAGEAVWPAEVLESLRQAPFRSQAIIVEPLALPPNESGFVPMLSPREQVMIGLLCSGLSNKLIARDLQIAEATVKVHVKAVLRKLRVANRTQAAIWAHNNGYAKGGEATWK